MFHPGRNNGIPSPALQGCGHVGYRRTAPPSSDEPSIDIITRLSYAVQWSGLSGLPRIICALLLWCVRRRGVLNTILSSNCQCVSWHARVKRGLFIAESLQLTSARGIILSSAQVGKHRSKSIIRLQSSPQLYLSAEPQAKIHTGFLGEDRLPNYAPMQPRAVFGWSLEYTRSVDFRGLQVAYRWMQRISEHRTVVIHQGFISGDQLLG